MEILKNNLFPAHLLERVVNCYITGTLSNQCSQGSLPISPIFYFKLPLIGHFSTLTQKKICHFIRGLCNDLDMNLVFSCFKIGNLFVWKTLSLAGFVHVWFISLHVWPVMLVMSAFFHTSEHLVSDKASHIFKHLQNSKHCCIFCSVDCLLILDHASTSFQLKIKEAIHIQREQPSLNQQ